MQEPKITNATKVVFGPCRLSYVHLFAPYVPQGGGSEKYQTGVIIPKSETKTLQAIEKAIEAAKEAGKTQKWGGKMPKNLDLPLRDGDEKDDDSGAYDDCFYITAKCSTRPGIVSRNAQPIIDEEEVYSGMYAMVSVTFYPYDVNGNRGVACGLNNVMKWKDGECLGGRASAANDFADIATMDDDDDDL